MKLVDLKSQLLENFVRVKTHVGLEQLEVRFFFVEQNKTLQNIFRASGLPI